MKPMRTLGFRTRQRMDEAAEFRNGERDLVSNRREHGRAQHRQKSMRDACERHVAIPSGPSAHLIVVKANFAFGLLKIHLNLPACSSDTHEIREG